MDEWHVNPARFHGALSCEEHSVECGFTAGISASGEVLIELDAIERTPSSSFIKNHWEGTESSFGEFTLDGAGDGGQIFRTDDLIFTTLREGWHGSNGWFRPLAQCSTALFAMDAELNDEEGTRLLLRGLLSKSKLSASTPLGNVVARQIVEDPSADQMSGELRMSWPCDSDDIDAWRAQADRLFDRIRRALSFASGLMIYGPVRELVRNGHREIRASAHGAEARPYMGIFPSNDLRPIFEAAICSHFEPPLRVEKLDFAIEWLVMGAPYTEGRLIAAMTALENLASSNLSAEEMGIQSEDDYEQMRSQLSRVVKAHAAEKRLDAEDRKKLVSDINEKFPDLNRRTLKHKIEMLAARWSLSMEGLDPKAVAAAKRARDLIVHSGEYPHLPGEDLKLFDHLTVARELVTRFVLAALGFEGVYGSYVGGYHRREFGFEKNRRSTW